MPIMSWSDELSMNIELFDNEHKKLVELLNTLFDAMSKGEGHNTLDTMLIELANYTANHFKHEEEAMQKYNYPGLAAHKIEHKDFIAKVMDTKQKYEEGAIMLTMPLFEFLKSWVHNHISKSDFGYSAFLIKAGMK